SIRVKWCGVTSQVTRAFARLPRRTAFSASEVERCATCRRDSRICCASVTSRSTMPASAADDMPRSPSRKLVGPSCMEAFSVSRVSSACCTTGKFNSAPSRSAARIISSSRMGLPSSVTATAPARCNAAKSGSDDPRELRVAAAIGKTLTTAVRSGLRSHSTDSTESTTGTVLGMVQTEVKPPAAAAAVPVAIVSLYAWPGSRRCACRSMKPGATMSPRASNFSAFSSTPALILLGGATSATRPSFSSTSMGASMRAAGSMRWPPLISRLLVEGEFTSLVKFFTSSSPYFSPQSHRDTERSKSRFLDFLCDSVVNGFSSHPSHGPRQNRHARGHAVAHFLEDARLGAVGDFAGQFQAANDWAGMHHDGIFLGHLQAGRVHLVARDVFEEVDLQSGKTLRLHAQQHDHIGAAQGVINVAGDADAGSECRRNVGHEFRGTAKNDLDAEFA